MYHVSSLNGGGRLNFSNGIDFLALSAGILVVIFGGETHLLLPLYAVGVFASFTLSQAGMWWRWTKNKTPGWKHKAFINGLGAVVTFITVIIIGATKFMSGAWIVCLLVPVFIFAMLRVKSHYSLVAKQLSLSLAEVEAEVAWNKAEINHVIIPLASLNKASLKAICYAKDIADSQHIVAFHVSMDEDAAEKLRQKWQALNLGIPLVIYDSPFRNTVNPLLEFIASEKHASKPEDMITIVLPQFVVRQGWHNLLHNQTSYFIRNRLMRDRRIAIVTVPYVLKE